MASSTRIVPVSPSQLVETVADYLSDPLRHLPDRLPDRVELTAGINDLSGLLRSLPDMAGSAVDDLSGRLRGLPDMAGSAVDDLGSRAARLGQRVGHPGASKRRSRRRATWMAAVVAVIAGLGILALVRSGRRTGEGPSDTDSDTATDSDTSSDPVEVAGSAGGAPGPAGADSPVDGRAPSAQRLGGRGMKPEVRCM